MTSGRGPVRQQAAAGRSERVRWLHSGAVLAAGMAAARPDLVDGHRVAVRDLLAEGRRPEPTLEHLLAATAVPGDRAEWTAAGHAWFTRLEQHAEVLAA